MTVVSRFFPHPLFIAPRILPEATIYFSPVELIQGEPIKERSDRFHLILYRVQIPFTNSPVDRGVISLSTVLTVTTDAFT